VQTTNEVGYFASLKFDHEGVPWIAYEEWTNDDLEVARYVGSGGTGCTNDAWTCYEVDTSNTVVYEGLEMAIDGSGTPIIAYQYHTGNDLRTAKFVGSGGDCDTLYSGSDAWDCDVVDTTDSVGLSPAIAIDGDGNPWIAYRDSTNGALNYARYVSSGGSGCNLSSWDGCSAIDSSFPAHENSIAFDGLGTPWIASYNETSGGVMVAKLKLPPNSLTQGSFPSSGGVNAANSNGLHRLSPGVSPYTTAYGVCAGSLNTMGYCGGYANDGYYDSVTTLAYERPLYNLATKFDNNSELPTVYLQFKTDSSPATDNVVLQVYRYGTTDAWETVSTYSAAGCSTDNCNITAQPSGTISEYFEQDGSDYWMYFRVYQVEGSSAIEFELDSFRADKVQPNLRHGGVFREETLDPFNW
jgi:hypothetical protein